MNIYLKKQTGQIAQENTWTWLWKEHLKRVNLFKNLTQSTVAVEYTDYIPAQG